MNIAYIVSFKQPGLNAWTFREMVSLEKAGSKISVYPTKFTFGPYMPKKNWFTARWNFFDILLSQLRWLFSRPDLYLKTLFIALRYFTISEFGLAAYFSLHMKKQCTERIHCHLGDKKLYVGYFCKLLLRNIPLSVTIHAHELYINPNWKLFPVALKTCDHIICIADLNKKILKDEWGIPDEKLKVIRLFGFSNYQDENPTIIFCVGRYESKKGHDILLEAISQLIDEGLDIELWLAGSPDPASSGVDVLGYAKNLGIQNRVVAFGEVGEKILKVLYRQCDIFCLLSRHDENGVPEGIPVVLMEAMSMGKPVVATDTGATNELVQEILIAEEDTQAAVGAIRRLVNNPDLRRNLGQKNMEIVRASYSEENVRELFKVLTS